jgi:hypothetical protein
MVTSSNLDLFHGYNKRKEVESDANTAVNKVFRETSADELLETSEDEFVEKVMNEVDMDIPDIEFEGWKAETTGTGGKRRLEIPLKYSGDANLLEVNPSGYDSPDPVKPSDDGKRSFRPSVTRSRLTFSFNLSNLDSEDPNQEIEDALDEIKEGLEALQDDLENMKQEIRDDARERYQKQKKQAKENENKLDKLDIPIEDRDED